MVNPTQLKLAAKTVRDQIIFAEEEEMTAFDYDTVEMMAFCTHVLSCNDDVLEGFAKEIGDILFLE